MLYVLPPRTRGLRLPQLCAVFGLRFTLRTRGLHLAVHLHLFPVRFTPAHAGITSASSRFPSLSSGSPPRTRGLLHCRKGRKPSEAVHPRACGDYIMYSQCPKLTPGSPPRTRGLPLEKVQEYKDYRFTPAHTGITRWWCRGRRQPSVHPRAHGDYSPPQSARPGAVRFTPAHTGITESHTVLRHMWPVHPRAHGDYVIPTSVYWFSSGSPPRTRGLRWRQKHLLLRHPVHPRARRDYSALYCLSTRIRGSPPRTRGLRVVDHGRPARHRFTPAHAGITGRLSTVMTRRTVHPRAHGDYLLILPSFGTAFGSPPRTRGLHVVRIQHHRAGRFTPAHTGITFNRSPIVAS